MPLLDALEKHERFAARDGDYDEEAAVIERNRRQMAEFERTSPGGRQIGRRTGRPVPPGARRVGRG